MRFHPGAVGCEGVEGAVMQVWGRWALGQRGRIRLAVARGERCMSVLPRFHRLQSARRQLAH